MSSRSIAIWQLGAGVAGAYDPCNGRTLLLEGVTLPSGRHRLAETLLSSAPTIHPAALARRWPVSICWSPLVRCNLSCPHCLDDKSLSPAGGAARVEIARALAASQIMGVDVSGGEPLLLPELPMLLRTLRGGGLAVSVTTNGWRLAQRSKELVAHLDAVRISFDGASAASHDRWRGKGSFRRALAGLDAVVAAGIPVQIQFTLMRDTAGELDALATLAAEHGAHGITVLQMLPIGEGAALADEQMLSDEQAAELVDELRTHQLPLRLRLRSEAEGFTVVRADGRVWHNGTGAQSIHPRGRLRCAADLLLDGIDGSA